MFPSTVAFITLALAITSASAAPSTQPQCRPGVISGNQFIVSTSSPTLAWEAEFGSDVSEGFGDINASTLDKTSQAQQWVLTSLPRHDAFIIASAVAPTTACAAETGGPINSEDCTNPADGNQALQFFIICQECYSTTAKGCLIQSANEGQYASFNEFTTVRGQNLEEEDFQQTWDFVAA